MKSTWGKGNHPGTKPQDRAPRWARKQVCPNIYRTKALPAGCPRSCRIESQVRDHAAPREDRRFAHDVHENHPPRRCSPMAEVMTQSAGQSSNRMGPGAPGTCCLLLDGQQQIGGRRALVAGNGRGHTTSHAGARALVPTGWRHGIRRSNRQKEPARGRQRQRGQARKDLICGPLRMHAPMCMRINCARQDSNLQPRGSKPRALSNCATGARIECFTSCVSCVGINPSYQTGHQRQCCWEQSQSFSQRPPLRWLHVHGPCSDPPIPPTTAPCSRFR